MGVTFLDEEPVQAPPTVTFLDDDPKAEEHIYFEDTEEVISAPAGMDSLDVDFYNNLQNGNRKKGDHFGKQLVRGFGGFFASTPQILASEMIRDAEAFQETYNSPLGPADFFRAVSPFHSPLASGGGSMAKIQNALGFDGVEDYEASQRYMEEGQKLLDDNRAFLERNGLVKTEEDGIAFDVGSGFGSVPTAIGMTVLTKNPATATVFFGGMQRSQTYIEAREKGFSPEEARGLSNVFGIVEGGIEAIGGKVFLDAVGADKVIKKIIIRTLNEGGQEAAQQAGEEIVGQTSGLREVDVGGAMQRILYSGTIGIIVGAPTTTVVSTMERQAKDAGIPEAEYKPIIEAFAEARGEIEAAGADIIARETSPETKDADAETQVAEVMRDFIDGNDISPEKIAAAKEELNIPEDFELNPEDAKAVQVQRDIEQGRIAQLDQDIEQVDAQIDRQAEIVADREVQGLPTIASGRKLQKLIEQRDALDNERGQFVDNFVGPRPEVKNEPVKIKGRRLRSIEAESKKNSIRALNKGFRDGRKLAVDNIQAAQKSLRKTIMSSGLTKSERDGFVTEMLALKSPEQLNERLPIIQQRIEATLQKRFKKDAIGRIGKKLKQYKSRPAKPVKGKLDPETNAAIDTVGKAFALTKDAAQERLEKNLAVADLPSPLTALENSILSLKADPRETLLSDVEAIEAQIDGIIEEGTSAAADRALKQLRLDTEMKEEFLDLGSMKTKAQLKPAGTVQELLKNLESGYINQSGVFRMKVKNALTGAIKSEEKRVDKFIDSISLTKESRDFEAGKAKSTRDFVKKVLARGEFKNETALFRYLHKTSGDVVINEMISFKQKNPKTGEVELVRKRLRMTRSEARKRYMELQDEQMLDVLQSPEANGYTQEIINKIIYSLEPIDIAVAKGQLDFYEDYYERINETYKQVYGINLPKVEFYSPIRRKFEDGNIDEFMSGINYRGGIAPNSLKSRTPNLRPLEQLSDVTTLYSHMSEMEYFIAFSEKVGRLNRVFKSSDVQRVLDENITDAMRKSLNRDLDYFARKGIEQAKAGEQIITTLARNFSLSVLGAKPQVGLKQVTSFAAYADDVSTADFVAGISYMASHPKKVLDVLRSSTLWQNRGLNIDKDFQDALNDKHFLNLASRFPKFTEVMMLPIKYGDKAAIGIGGYARYHAQRKAGMSHAEAIADFEAKTARTQQSTDIDQQSELQRSKGVVRLVAQFMSAPNALMRAEYDAIATFIAKGGIKGTGKAQFAKKMFIYHFFIPQFFTLVANGFTFDEEDQFQALVLGSLNGWLIWGDVLEALVSWGIKGDYFEPEIRHPADFTDAMLKAADAFSKDGLELDEFLEGNKAIEKALDGTGKLTGIPMRTLYNDMVGVGKVINGDVEEGSAYMMGYSPWIVKNKILQDE